MASRHDRVGRVLLRCLLVACRLLSTVIAVLHALSGRVHITRLPSLVSDAPAGLIKTLEEIWFGHFARELLSVALRSPLRASALELVSAGASEHVNAACIVAICHTPWVRLLASWCRDHNFALVLSGPKWAKHTGGAHVPDGLAGLRRTLRHLRHGGRIITVADVFSDPAGAPVRFLGQDRMASRLAARLASRTRAPILAVVPVFRENRLHLDVGAVFHVGESVVEQCEVTTKLLTFLDAEIRTRPEVWSNALHVDGPAGAPDPSAEEPPSGVRPPPAPQVEPPPSGSRAMARRAS